MRQLTGTRIFLTGATGFIGRRVLAVLKEQGATILAPSRSATGKKWLSGQGALPIDASFDDQNSLVRAMSGCDLVIHLAYDIRASGTENLAVFKNILGAARAAGVQGLVHTSSVVVYDDWPSGDISEASPITPSGSAYRRAKIEMEQIALSQQLPVSIIQPTLVYGPGSSLWTTRFARALMQGGVVIPQDAGTAHLVYVDDVARAIVLTAGSLPTASGRYLITGPSDARWPDYLSGLAEILETPPAKTEKLDTLIARAGPRPNLDAPPAAPSLAARVSAFGRRLVGHENFERVVALASSFSGKSNTPLYPDHVLLDLYGCQSTVQITRVAKELEYYPAFDLNKGLDATTSFLHDLRAKG